MFCDVLVVLDGIYGHEFNERQLQQILDSYVRYYNRTRTQLALAKDSPEGRTITTAARGRVVSSPQVGGLHQRYERLAA